MAAAPATSFDDIRKSLKKGDIAPVYILHGEEGYFIDALTKDFEDILSDDEKEFNQYVLYAPETEPESVMNLCRRIPMMADRQVVILKEAQAVRADKIAKLKAYVADPVSTTVLVICSRGAALKGKDLFDAAKKGGAVVFESKKIAEWNIAAIHRRIYTPQGPQCRPEIGRDAPRLHRHRPGTPVQRNRQTHHPAAAQRRHNTRGNRAQHRCQPRVQQLRACRRHSRPRPRQGLPHPILFPQQPQSRTPCNGHGINLQSLYRPADSLLHPRPQRCRPHGRARDASPSASSA